MTDATDAGGLDSGQAQAEGDSAPAIGESQGDKSTAPTTPAKGSAEKLTLEQAASKAFDEIEAKAAGKTEPGKTAPKRDAQGRFQPGQDKPADGTEKPEAEAKDKTEGDKPKDEAKAAKDGTKPATATAEVKPPQHWAPRDREVFDKLPAEAKPLAIQFIKSLEAGYTTKFQEIAGDRKRIEPMRPLLDAIKRDAEADGINEAEAVGRLYRAHLGLVQDPEKALPAICRAYGIDLAKFLPKQAAAGQAAEAQPGDGYIDPQIVELRTAITDKDSKIALLERKLDSFIGQQTQTAQAREQAALNDAVQSFSSATDQSGAPKYPHFEDVRGIMGDLMMGGSAKTMDEAYAMAVNASPAIRAKVEADRRAREEAEQKAAKEAEAQKSRAAVEAARKAGRLSPSLQTHALKANPKSLREAAELAYEQMQAGR